MAESREDTPTKSTMSGEEKGGKTKNGAAESSQDDAITLLKNDHRKVEQLFESFKSASRRSEKKKIVQNVCRELIVHAMIEEEIFYPACRDHLDDDPLDEAQVEHDGAKLLINELLEASPDEPFYDAKVKVLSEMIKHHVNEEEKRAEGIFAKAKASGVDTDEIAQQLSKRKAELLAEIEKSGPERPAPRSFSKLKEAAEVGQGSDRSVGVQSKMNRDTRYRIEHDDEAPMRNTSTRYRLGRLSRDDDDDGIEGRSTTNRGGQRGYESFDTDQNMGRSDQRGQRFQSRERYDDEDGYTRNARRDSDYYMDNPRDAASRLSPSLSRSPSSSRVGRNRDDDDDDRRYRRRDSRD